MKYLYDSAGTFPFASSTFQLHVRPGKNSHQISILYEKKEAWLEIAPCYSCPPWCTARGWLGAWCTHCSAPPWRATSPTLCGIQPRGSDRESSQWLHTMWVWLQVVDRYSELSTWESRQRRFRPSSWYWKGESGRWPCNNVNDMIFVWFLFSTVLVIIFVV